MPRRPATPITAYLPTDRDVRWGRTAAGGTHPETVMGSRYSFTTGCAGGSLGARGVDGVGRTGPPALRSRNGTRRRTGRSRLVSCRTADRSAIRQSRGCSDGCAHRRPPLGRGAHPSAPDRKPSQSGSPVAVAATRHDPDLDPAEVTAAEVAATEVAAAEVATRVGLGDIAGVVVARGVAAEVAGVG